MLVDGSLVSGRSRFFRGDPKDEVAMFAQSYPLRSCSSSHVVPGLNSLFVNLFYNGSFPLSPGFSRAKFHFVLQC